MLSNAVAIENVSDFREKKKKTQSLKAGRNVYRKTISNWKSHIRYTHIYFIGGWKPSNSLIHLMYTEFKYIIKSNPISTKS